jgi:hypothetical protein
LVDGFRKIAGNLRQRRQQQIAEWMTVWTVNRVESVLQQLLERRIRACERSETVADIAWRQHAELAAEPSGAPSIIGYRDNRGDCVRRIRLLLCM